MIFSLEDHVLAKERSENVYLLR